MSVSPDAFEAMDKISDLCSKKNVKVMFLTLPMYKDHVCNYDVWRGNLLSLIERYNYPWLDLQHAYNDKLFGPECFENTYRKNQHMTVLGAQRASLLVSEYIKGML